MQSAMTRPSAVRLVQPRPSAIQRQLVRPIVLAQAKANTDNGVQAPKRKPKVKSTRAPSPFNYFTKAKFAAVKAELLKAGKEASLGACSSRLRELWEGLSPSQKAVYEKETATAKATIEKELAANPEAFGKRAPHPAGPKPLTPWISYVKANFAAAKSKNPSKKVTEITKELSDAWKVLPDKEKAKYIEPYTKAMAEWKERAAKLAPNAAAPKAAAAAAPKPAAAPAQQAVKAAAGPTRASTPTKTAAAPVQTTVQSGKNAAASPRPNSKAASTAPNRRTSTTRGF